MHIFRSLRTVLLFLCFATTTFASDSILRRTTNTSPAVIGPTFTLTLAGANSYLGVAATAGTGVTGSASGDMFLRTNQKMLISTNSGASVALTIDAAGNLAAAGSVTAPSFVGSVTSATNFTGPLAGDVTGSQGATQVAFVGGQSAANVASGAAAANAATDANTAYAIAKRDRAGQIAVSSIRFADGSVLSSAPSLRKYYLTKSSYNGAQTTTACDAGFHMASIWEVLNVSTLSYDTARGHTLPDSGSGPPQSSGWIRTGYNQDNVPWTGVGNCLAWTSNLQTDYGTYVYLTFDATTASSIFPWKANTESCANFSPVWCVQD